MSKSSDGRVDHSGPRTTYSTGGRILAARSLTPVNAPLIGALAASFQGFLTSRRRDFELELRGSDGSVRKLSASGASAEDIAEALAALRDG